ncbi:unnamed protein product, partial [Linum tenue]
ILAPKHFFFSEFLRNSTTSISSLIKAYSYREECHSWGDAGRRERLTELLYRAFTSSQLPPLVAFVLILRSKSGVTYLHSNMDPQHLAETLKHLSKQDELLREVLGSLQGELTKLKAEELMLMEKYSQLKNPLELIIRSKEDGNGLDGETGQTEEDGNGLDGQTGQTIPLITSGTNDSVGDEVDHTATSNKDK